MGGGTGGCGAGGGGVSGVVLSVTLPCHLLHCQSLPLAVPERNDREARGSEKQASPVEERQGEREGRISNMSHWKGFVFPPITSSFNPWRADQARITCLEGELERMANSEVEGGAVS